MGHELAILRSLLRLARRRAPATVDELAVRLGLGEADVRTLLASLGQAGFVRDWQQHPMLTLQGFAVAVASAATPQPTAQIVRVPIRSNVVVRRRSAA